MGGGEYKNRLLALVAHEDSCGIFSFASSRWPPESFSDLTIESVYPLNDDLKLDASKKRNNFNWLNFRNKVRNIAQNNDEIHFKLIPQKLKFIESFIL